MSYKNVYCRQTRRWISQTITALVILFSIAYLSISVFLPEQVLSWFTFRLLVIATPSMEPILNVHDVIFIQKVDPQSLQVGDIITFRVDINRDGQTEVVTHYLVAIEPENHYRTQGVDQTVYDPWILTEKEILGRYQFKIAQMGWVFGFFLSPWGLLFLFVQAMITFLSMANKSINKVKLTG